MVAPGGRVEGDHVGDGHHAHHVIDVVDGHREAGVAGVEQIDDPGGRLGHADRGGVDTGTHGLRGGPGPEVQPVVQQPGGVWVPSAVTSGGGGDPVQVLGGGACK